MNGVSIFSEIVGVFSALDKPEWVTDERFATGAARNINRDLRLKMTEEALMTMTLAEATERLNREQVPAPRSISTPESTTAR